MSTPTLLVCFRCEWSGPGGRSEVCPRCGAGLYRLEQPRRDRPAELEASPLEQPDPRPSRKQEPVEFLGADGGATTPSRRTVTVAVASAVAVLVVGAMLGLGDPGPLERPGASLPISEVSVPGRTAAVAGALRGRTDRLTLTTVERTSQGTRLYRLWRLDVATGALVPGPVVAEVRDLRLQPGSTDRRMAYLVDGGGLFFLEGFHASRPEWLAGGISAFEPGLDGRILTASISQQTAPWGSGVEVRLEVRRLSPDDVLGPPLLAQRIRGLDVEGVRVRHGTVYLWGRGGAGVVDQASLDIVSELVMIDPSGWTDRHRLGAARVLDVGPDGGVLLTAPGVRSSLYAEHPSDRAVPLRGDIRVDSVLAWSTDGESVAVVGEGNFIGRGVWLLDLNGGPPTPLLPPMEQLDGGAAFTADGRFVVWGQDRDLMAIDMVTGQRHRIGLPSRFPRLIAPVAAG